MRENRTSGSVQGAPGNRRSYCETDLAPFIALQVPQALPRDFDRHKAMAADYLLKPNVAFVSTSRSPAFGR